MARRIRDAFPHMEPSGNANATRVHTITATERDEEIKRLQEQCAETGPTAGRAGQGRAQSQDGLRWGPLFLSRPTYAPVACQYAPYLKRINKIEAPKPTRDLKRQRPATRQHGSPA